jgi:adenylosuccinate synthase
VGVRVCDLLDRRVLRGKTEILAGQAGALERAAGVAAKPPALESVDAVVERFCEFGQRLRPMMVDVSRVLNQALDEGKTVLFEGAQGTMLDLDHGTYPFVSSSSATAGGACTGTGVGPTRIDEVIGVAKAYTTRVGNGPFPTELPPEQSSVLREAGGEYGATTGRPRRCGWFDAVVVRHSVRVNGITHLYLTKLDVLDGSKELKVCTEYRLGGETLRSFPAGVDEAFGVEPVYESHPGWDRPVKGARSRDGLPPAALAYVRRIEELTGARVAGVSVGSGREEMVFFS